VLAATIAVAALALALGAWATLRLARDRPVILRQLIAGGVVELALLAQVVVAAVLTMSGHVLAEPVTFWGYIVFALVVLPGAALWAFADRTRWSSAVLLVAAATVGVMELRMWQLWSQVNPG
jgi:hypothetical protein